MRVIKVSIAKGFVVDGDKPTPHKNSIDLTPLKQITEGLINNQSPEVPQALEPIVESIKLIIAKIDAIKPGESKDYTEQLADIDNQIKSALSELESVKQLQINYNSNNQSLTQEIVGYRAQVESLGNGLSSLGSAISNLLTQDEFAQYKQQIEQATGELSKKIDNLPKGGGQSVEPKYVSEVGEIVFNANSYPFTNNKVMFQNAFTDIPYIDVMIAYTDGSIPTAYFSYALYDVDKSGFKCRITGVHANREWVAKYKATGKVK
ncbi:hypothetical protein [Aggregatibacter kilianii]|uniref:hypothetical protein n=1 Tax=Aggregatibacter kilianii TaxID=2025884 RepID=UPI000D65ACEF|nr:hypothetical protein [Aggregatibacter kilianii]